jgi:hypothetical protein
VSRHIGGRQRQHQAGRQEQAAMTAIVQVGRPRQMRCIVGGNGAAQADRVDPRRLFPF